MGKNIRERCCQEHTSGPTGDDQRTHRVIFPTGYNNNVQILPAPGYVTITHEMMRDTRIRGTREIVQPYLTVPAPAAAVTPSCCAVPPDAPMAPMILPPAISGRPPSTAVAPSSDRIRHPSPPAASAS